MKSNVCKINNGISDLSDILNESAKVAVYNDFDQKQSLQLRLICEEIDGMLPNIIDEFEGDFWIECEDDTCKVNVSIKIPEFNVRKKEELVGIAKSKRNAAAVGIVGKIRNVIENFLLDDDAMSAINISSSMYHFSSGLSGGVDYACFWSLEEYRLKVKKEEQSEAWDELEKSVLACVADDVIVKVKGSCADIVIVKKIRR